MSSSDCLPDYPLNSDLVKRLKSSLEARDEKAVLDLICTEVKHVNAIIELANDDWMKEPDAPLHPLVLVGNWNEWDVFESMKCQACQWLAGYRFWLPMGDNVQERKEKGRQLREGEFMPLEYFAVF